MKEITKSFLSKKKNKRYILELNEEQFQVISQALECYARVGTGQFDVALERQIYSEKDDDKRNEIRKQCHVLKYLTTGMSEHASIGIAQAEPDYRLARDMRWAMMNYHLKDSREYSTYSGDPKTAYIAGKYPMIKIKEKEVKS